MKNADYRKINNRRRCSSTYHKKDGTAVRAILKREGRRHLLDGEITVSPKNGKFYVESIKKENVESIKKEKDQSTYIKNLENAFIDLVDGTDPGDIQSMTGLQMDRVNEIFDIYKIVERKKSI